ncbi:MAG: SufE family protein [Nitrospina sp.]|jgi:cysteine desulfuration protein SufE|nr:SufE family protein [Nitrospina sp.]
MTAAPAEPTAAEAQEAIVEEMAFFDDWSDRYRYLIDLGRALPEFPLEWCTDEFKIKGCQSQVWMRCEHESGVLNLRATSDAAIVSGLIALLLRVYSGRSPQEVLATQPEFISRTGLDSYLSPTRSNGLASMLEATYRAAQNASA